MCSPNQNDRSNAWIQWLHWAEECCINLVSSPYHQYGVEIYLRLSPARSLDVRLTHPCIHFPFVLSLTKYNSTEACAIYQVQSPFNPALSGHGQIAPPLIMLLFLACRHNWNKAPPPSTLDGWECCLLSKTMVDYLASRLLYVTSHIIRDNSSQQLSLFE